MAEQVCISAVFAAVLSAGAQGNAFQMVEQGCSCAVVAARSADAQGSALQMAEQVCICTLFLVHLAAAQGNALQMTVRCANSCCAGNCITNG